MHDSEGNDEKKGKKNAPPKTTTTTTQQQQQQPLVVTIPKEAAHDQLSTCIHSILARTVNLKNRSNDAYDRFRMTSVHIVLRLLYCVTYFSSLSLFLIFHPTLTNSEPARTKRQRKEKMMDCCVLATQNAPLHFF